jgi:lipopolysaccharide export system protein LptA
VRPNTPYSGCHGGVFLATLCAALILVMVDISPAGSAQPSSGKVHPSTLSSGKASSAKTKNTASKQPAADNQAASQNGPFGMLKFSSDNGPIQIKSNSLNLDYKNNTVDFIGDVHATQSGTTLTSKALKVLYGAKFGEIKQVIAMGDVKMTQGGRSATGQRAVLDEVKHTVEMTGAPVIHDGPDSVAGRRIIIYLDTEKSVVEGASAVIFPRNNNNGKSDHEAAD